MHGLQACLFRYITVAAFCIYASVRVPTRQGKVREIWFSFKVREKSGKSVKWSGKLENLQKSGKSQGILKSCLVNPSKIKQTNMR